MNRLKSFEIAWNHLVFIFKKFGIFLFIYQDGKSIIKRKYWEKILKQYVKEPIFTGKEYSFRIRKRFYRIERQRIKRNKLKFKKR